MNVRVALAALAVLALVPQAFASAQQTQQTQQSTRTTITTTNGPQSRDSQHDRRFHRRDRPPSWAPIVIIDSSMVQQMLNSPMPKPPSGKNKINKPGGEVFKSIGN